MNSRKEFLRFLQQIQPQDRIAIYALGTSLQVLHDFTNDPAELVNAITRHAARLPTELNVSSGANGTIAEAIRVLSLDSLDRNLGQTGQLVAAYYIERRTEIPLRALEELANHLGGLPGRKSLIWVSGGFPFSYGRTSFQLEKVKESLRSFYNPLARTSRSITNASVSIYPVDARMLAGGALASSSYEASSSTIAGAFVPPNREWPSTAPLRADCGTHVRLRLQLTCLAAPEFLP